MVSHLSVRIGVLANFEYHLSQPESDRLRLVFKSSGRGGGGAGRTGSAKATKQLNKKSVRRNGKASRALKSSKRKHHFSKIALDV